MQTQTTNLAFRGVISVDVRSVVSPWYSIHPLWRRWSLGYVSSCSETDIFIDQTCGEHRQDVKKKSS